MGEGNAHKTADKLQTFLFHAWESSSSIEYMCLYTYACVVMDVLCQNRHAAMFLRSWQVLNCVLQLATSVSAHLGGRWCGRHGSPMFLRSWSCLFTYCTCITHLLLLRARSKVSQNRAKTTYDWQKKRTSHI